MAKAVATSNKGTLASIHPSATEVGFYSKNLKDANKQVVVTVDGDSYVLSPALTALFRAKTITTNDLGAYEVRGIKLDDGTSLNSLGMPGEDIKVQVAWATGAAVAKVEVKTQEDLHAIVAF